MPKPNKPAAKTPKAATPKTPKSPPVRDSGWNERRWEGTRIGEERARHEKLPGGK